jgi:hypothetical protein
MVLIFVGVFRPSLEDGPHFFTLGYTGKLCVHGYLAERPLETPPSDLFGQRKNQEQRNCEAGDLAANRRTNEWMSCPRSRSKSFGRPSASSTRMATVSIPIDRHYSI